MLNQLMLVLTLVLLCGFEGKRWRVGLTELFTCLFLFFFVFAMCTCGLVDGTLKARCCRWFWCLQLKTELFIHVAATRTYTNAHTHTYTQEKEKLLAVEASPAVNYLLWKKELLALYAALSTSLFFFLYSLFFFFLTSQVNEKENLKVNFWSTGLHLYHQRLVHLSLWNKRLCFPSLNVCFTS